VNYNIVLTEHFKAEAKKLTKKYRSLKAELETLGKKLSDNPTIGTSLGHDVYKIRLTVASKGKGKSGGARIITYVKVIDEVVYMVSIYDKSKLENLTKKQILELLRRVALM
jgi:mRNA-degrading endonuclease RelE of RelBE toxin-antitoxin system